MKENYKGLPWYSRETIKHQFPITDEERLKLADIMADSRAKITELQNELAEIKKSLKEQIDSYAGQLSDAAMKYKSGLADPVDALCDHYQDLEKGEMVYVFVEDNEEIRRRPLKGMETQPVLFSSVDRSGAAITKFSSQ